LYSVTTAFQGAAQAAVGTVSAMEDTKMSFESLIASEMVSVGAEKNIAAARRESVDVAAELMKWNRALAANSPLDAGDVTQTLRLSQAYGFLATQTMSVEQAQKAGIVTSQRMTQAMADLAAGTGSSSSSMTNIVTQLGQVQASGRATGEEIRTLSEWGVPALRYIAEELGVTTDEVLRMQSAGELTYDKVITPIVIGIEREFGGAAIRATSTITGLQAAMADLQKFALADLFGPSIMQGKEYFAEFLEVLQAPEIQENIQWWAEVMAEATIVVGDSTRAAADIIQTALIPVLSGATVAWAQYNAVQGIAIAQQKTMLAGGVLQYLGRDFGILTSAIGKNIASVNAWMLAHKAMTAAMAGGAVVALGVYAYQEYNKTLDEHTENLFANSERWATLQKAREAYANASPEIQAALKSDMEALEASAEATEEQTRADADAAARSGLFQSREEATRIAAQNANIRTKAVQESAMALLLQIETEDKAAIAALETAEADNQAALAAARRKAAIQEYLRDERDLRLELMQDQERIETDHQQALRDLDEDIADQRIAAAQERDEKLITIERNRRDALAQEAEAYIVRLHDLAESAADAGISALSDVTAADVAFIRDSRTRLAEYNDTRETLHRQGALACSREELDALIEQEAQAARSYAEQESELEAHLGRRLIAYTQAQALIYGVSQDATNAMVQGIAREFGVLETASQRSFGQMRESIDVWAQSGGKNTQQVIAGFGALRREAVETELAYEKLMDTRSEELARAFAEGRISEADYLSQLQTLGRDVSLSLGLGIDESAYSTDVTSAAEEHRARLVEIDRNANQERITAYQEWAEKDEELRTTYREEQREKLQDERDAEMERARGAYQEELTELIRHHDDLEAEDLRHLREARQRQAEHLIGIDEDAQRKIDALRARNLPLAEELAEYERIIADAERRRRLVEATPTEEYERREKFYEPPKEPWAPPDPATEWAENAARTPRLPPRKAPWRPPSPADRLYGSSAAPISVVVQSYNPVVDTPERERRWLAQTREQVRATLDEWTSDALLRGRLGE
jgi:tape measure domain-containing protein